MSLRSKITYVDEILTQDSTLDLASLDVEFLFANIPLNKSIIICINKLFQKAKILVNELSINDFRNFLNFATKETFFNFQQKVSQSKWIVLLRGSFQVQ